VQNYSLIAYAEFRYKTTKDLIARMTARTPVNVFYHVTNIASTDPKPSWKTLEPNESYSEQYDGPALCDKKFVHLSTTRYKAHVAKGRGLPNRTVYPREVTAKRYKRVSIPKNQFDNYRIFFLKRFNNQVRLALWPPGEDVPHFFKDLEEYKTGVPNDYLWRDENNNWKTNDYFKQDQKYFVGVAVFDPVDIKSGYKWDTVTHM